MSQIQGSVAVGDTAFQPAIVMERVNKWYGTLHVLRDLSITIGHGEKIVVCGPSGSGKSTMIRCINRLKAHQEGRIIVDGTEITDDLRQLLDRTGGALPGAAGVLFADHARQFVQGDIDLVLDHRGAGERAAVHGLAPVDDQHATLSIRQRMRHQRAGNAGADDDYVVVLGSGRLMQAKRKPRCIGPEGA